MNLIKIIMMMDNQIDSLKEELYYNTLVNLLKNVVVKEINEKIFDVIVAINQCEYFSDNNQCHNS